MIWSIWKSSIATNLPTFRVACASIVDASAKTNVVRHNKGGPNMNITVYLGASAGNDPAFLPAVQELGNWIGANGHALVYGGSKSGLMGALADSVLEAGGHVTGVEPSFFIEAEFQHDGIDDLIVTSDMAERKAKMIAVSYTHLTLPTTPYV